MKQSELSAPAPQTLQALTTLECDLAESEFNIKVALLIKNSLAR
jgi:hypothetical protein